MSLSNWLFQRKLKKKKAVYGRQDGTVEPAKTEIVGELTLKIIRADGTVEYIDDVALYEEGGDA